MGNFVLNKEKYAIRSEILIKRNSVSNSDYSYYNLEYKRIFFDFFHAYLKIHNPKIIGGYYPIHKEFNVLPILNICRQMNFKTALPYCHGKSHSLTFHNFDGNENLLKPDKYKILSPDPLSSIVIPDLVICPALAINKYTKQRLGYGGGFFDYYASLNPYINFVAGFYNFQILDNRNIFQAHDLILYDYFELKLQ
jgi:5,10-methenyltetrahydrofolate synthetase